MLDADGLHELCCECYAAIGFGSWLRKNVSERSKATSDGRSLALAAPFVHRSGSR